MSLKSAPFFFSSIIFIVLHNLTWAYDLIEESYIIYHPTELQLKQISMNPELILDHPKHDSLELHGPKGLGLWLKDLGVEFEKEHHHQESHSISKNFQALTWPTSKEIERKLKSIHQKYPHLTQLFSIGKSHQGQDLWVMKISDKPNQDLKRPEFKYISSMHGDEIVGRDMLILFMEELLSKYHSDQRVSQLIENTEIFILPSMNPDGSDRKRRGNARNIDLNRNFPHFDVSVSLKNNREPETKAVMDFHDQRNFALSANFHGGAVCVNYPWDSTYERHPMDNFIQELSLRYSRPNSTMYGSREFTHGITNGADWYRIKGGMQDWSYVFYNDLQVTVELSDVKWPNYNKIRDFYRENKESLMDYLESIHEGFGFYTSRKQNGVVRIKRLSPNPQDLGEFRYRNGEFYKVLPSGQYIFMIDHSKTLQVTVDQNISQLIELDL